MRPMSLFPLAPPLRATTLAPLSRSHVDFFSFFLSLSSHLFLSLNKKIPPRPRPAAPTTSTASASGSSWAGSPAR